MRIGEQKWHRSCLQCMQCKKSLQFETCNDQHGVPLCSACAEPYLPPASHHAYTTHAHGRQTHSGFKNRAACFYCSGCGKSIHGEIFVAMNKVCTSACHVNTWLARGGNELTPAGSSHATPWEQNWHEGCFACTVCRVPFAHTFYAGPDGRPYCSLHIRPSRSITS